MNWESTADGHRCTRHGIEFLRGEVCHSCTTDPGDDASAANAESDAIDKALAAKAAEYESRARTMWRLATKMQNGGVPADVIQSAKLSAESVKWERLSTETSDKLAARKHLREVIAKRAAMSGKRGPN